MLTQVAVPLIRTHILVDVAEHIALDQSLGLGAGVDLFDLKVKFSEHSNVYNLQIVV